MRRKTRIKTEPFTDLLFNTLLGFTFLFFITVLFINPISKIGNVNIVTTINNIIVLLNSVNKSTLVLSIFFSFS